MHQLIYQEKVIATDNDGYLRNLSDWNQDIAALIAEQADIGLSPAHWQVLNLILDFYQQYDINPAMRILIKLWRQLDDNASSMQLMQLFGQSPLKLACKIAGLPKPTNCL